MSIEIKSRTLLERVRFDRAIMPPAPPGKYASPQEVFPHPSRMHLEDKLELVEHTGMTVVRITEKGGRFAEVPAHRALDWTPAQVREAAPVAAAVKK